MITPKEFMDRAKERALPRDHLNRYDTISTIMGMLPKAWKNEYPNRLPPLFKKRGIALFMDANEGAASIRDDHLMDNYVWDRTTQTFILNIECGLHEMFTGYLHALFKGVPSEITGRTLASNYIREGMGFVLSSIAMLPTKGVNVELTPQEKKMFKHTRFEVFTL